jgi:hypothetical protein
VVSKAKLYSKLDELEDQLRKKIIPHLMCASEGNNDLIFCVKGFNPYREFKNRTDKQTEELIEMGSQILSLREKLGESSSGSIAQRICWYCREWANTSNRHKPSGKSLAKQFLQEIEAE